MARMTPITVKGENQLGVTIDESVGYGGKNKFGDLLLVQVMLNYLITANLWNWGVQEPPPPPLPSGIFDQGTRDAIIYYQHSRSIRLLNEDWRIDPPNYGKVVKNGGDPTWVGRNLVNLDNRLMMMTLMHFEARKAAKHVYLHSTYVTGLRSFFEPLFAHLEDKDLLNVLK